MRNSKLAAAHSYSMAVLARTPFIYAVSGAGSPRRTAKICKKLMHDTGSI